MNVFITNENRPNYPLSTALYNLCKKPVTTVDEYVAWVGEWKEMHQQLVGAIKFMRALKNVSKAEKDGLATRHWVYKKYFGTLARQMYRARNENKARLKAGEFKEVELV